MSNSTVAVGYGVVAAKGNVPSANNTVLANISGGVAFPTMVPINDLPITADDMTVGTTTITGGTTTRILYDNAGVLGEYTISGSGTVVAMATSPSFTTPILGTPQSGTLTSCTGLPVSTGISGLGTGVATALAINVGSAGAPVVLNGALGTPSSGVATNITGLPIAGITGLGTGVATALAANVTGSGGIALATSPSFTTPTLGAAAATTINFGAGATSIGAITAVTLTSPDQTLAIVVGGTTIYVQGKLTND